VLVGGCALAILVLAISVLTAPRRFDIASPAAAPETSAPAGTTTTTTSARPELVPAIVGDNLVQIGDDRFEVGGPGDQILLGDWDCDGAETVALFRPASGDVFVFDDWATPGQALTVRSMARTPGGTHALADDPDDDGCPALVIETAVGERIEVES
jgi:hypothetical protein